MGTGDEYARALVLAGKTVDAIETALTKLDAPTPLTADMVYELLRSHKPTRDELTLVLNALTSIGGLSAAHGSWGYDPTVFERSSPLRAGVRAGIDVGRTAPAVRLLAALPPPFEPTHLAPAFWDLRAALVDLIASAGFHLLLASPFWDRETAQELLPVLARQTQRGVTVDLIGRSVDPTDRDGRELATLIDALGAPGQVRATTWYSGSRTEPGGVQTFHFKCAVADQGARAYLGSANFTASGLRSRAELGVLLLPPLSVDLYDLVVALLTNRST